MVGAMFTLWMVNEYQVLDYRSNCLVYPSNNDIHDHAMGLDKAVALLKDLCAERGVTF